MGSVVVYHPRHEPDPEGDHVPWFNNDDLWERYQDYRRWCYANPFVQRTMKARSHYDEEGNLTESYVMVPVDTVKMRMPSIPGFMEHLGLTTRSWEMTKDRREFDFGVRRVEESIETLQMEMAVSGMGNATVISRALELADTVNLNLPSRMTVDPAKLSASAIEEILNAQDSMAAAEREGETRG